MEICVMGLAGGAAIRLIKTASESTTWLAPQMIRKAVVPAAGMGTRLLSVTKEQPKEMLPIFMGDAVQGLSVKPLLQAVYEQLFEIGIEEFCFIVGRGKRAIEDHFTPDRRFIASLSSKGKSSMAQAMEEFYRRIEKSIIIWVNQPEPKGFGDSVLKAESLAATEDFVVHAGDTYIISDQNSHLKRLLETHEEKGADATFILQEVEDPRSYGVAEATEIEPGVLLVRKVVEKPEEPPSNLAIMPIYVFDPVIFKAIRNVPAGKGGELQLTDAIQKLIDWGLKVYGVMMKPDEVRLDIGTPETYWEALEASYGAFSPKKG